MRRVRTLQRFEGRRDSHRRRQLRPEALEPYLHGLHDEHFVQPRAISISQSTEYGDAYTADETREVCGLAHERGLLVHVDGGRT